MATSGIQRCHSHNARLLYRTRYAAVMQTVQEIYRREVVTLPARERLKLASMILRYVSEQLPPSRGATPQTRYFPANGARLICTNGAEPDCDY